MYLACSAFLSSFKVIILQFSKPFCKWWLFFLLRYWRQLISGLTEKGNWLANFFHHSVSRSPNNFVQYNVYYDVSTSMEYQQQQYNF